MSLLLKSWVGGTGGGGQSWESYWASQPEVLFFGLYADIAGGQMPNRVSGSSDYLTVAGAAGSETYQCPNTTPYIAADTDYIWFKTDASQRTVTTAELIGYDLQRTPVKYEDASPNEIVAIIILNASVTGTKREYLFRDMWLPILWDNNLNGYGHIKDNRLGQQLWTPESVYEQEVIDFDALLTTPLSDEQKARLTTLVGELKSGLGITTLAEAFDGYIIVANETEEAGLRNLVKNDFHGTKLTFVPNPPPFVQFEGIQGHASGQSIGIDWNGRTAGDATAYTLNSASYGVYLRTATDSTNYELHGVWSTTADGGTSNRIVISRPNGKDGNYSVAINSGTDTFSAPTEKIAGMCIASRTASNVQKLYVNKVPKVNGTVASTKIPDQKLHALATRINDGTVQYSENDYVSLIFWGKGFTQSEIDVITDTFEEYMDANGKGVIA